MVEVSFSELSKLREKDDSHKSTWEEVTRRFHHVGLIVKHKKDSWQRKPKICEEDVVCFLGNGIKKLMS